MRRRVKLMFICAVLLPAAALLAFEGDAPNLIGATNVFILGPCTGWAKHKNAGVSEGRPRSTRSQAGAVARSRKKLCNGAPAAA